MGYTKYATDTAVAVVLSAVFTAVSAAWMLFVRVPSVVKVRPELTEVGFFTGIFSGRGGVYLWYHYPEIIVVSEFVIIALTIVFIAWLYD